MTDTYETVPDTGSDDMLVDKHAQELAEEIISTWFNDEDTETTGAPDEMSVSGTTTAVGRLTVNCVDEKIDADELAESLNGGDES